MAVNTSEVQAKTGIDLKLTDVSGNETLILEDVGSAVNEITIKNAATGDMPAIKCTGEGNTGIIIANSENEEIIILDSIADSINELTITSAAASNGPSIAATGGDTNIDVNIAAKGSGNVNVSGTLGVTEDILHTGDTNNKISFTTDTQTFTTGGSSQDLDFQGDSGGALSIDLDSETLDIAGGTGITTTGSGNEVSIAVDASQTQITALGTIGTGIWQGTVVASAYLDADTAHLAGTQTFSGAKTFSANAKIVDDTTLIFGTDDNWTIEYDENGDDDLVLTGSDISIESSTSAKPVLTLLNTHADANPAKIQFKKVLNGSAAIDDKIGIISFEGLDDGDNPTTYGSIELKNTDETDGTEDASMLFNVITDGTTKAALSIEATIDQSTFLTDLAVESKAASSATEGGKLRLLSNDGAAMADGHQLGVITFEGMEDGNSANIKIGAQIEVLCDAGWSATENGADLVFSTNDGNNSLNEEMRLTAEGRLGIGNAAPDALLHVTGHASTDAVPALKITHQDADVTAIDIDLSNTTAIGIDIDANNTSHDVMDITANALAAGSALHIESSSTSTTAGSVVKIESTGNRAHDSNTVVMLDLNCDYTAGTAARALAIDSEQTTGKVVEIDASEITTGTGMELTVTGLTTGKGFAINADSDGLNGARIVDIYTDSTSTNAYSLLKVTKDSTNGDNSNAIIGLHVDFDTTAGQAANAVYIDSEQTDGTVFKIDAEGIAAGKAFSMDVSGLTTGKGFDIYANSSNTGTNSVVNINQANAAAVGSTALNITSAGGATAVSIDKNASGDAAQNAVGMHLDFDRTVAGSGTNAHNDIGIDLDVNSASLGASSAIGLDIDVVGATSGTHKATGLDVTVSASDTNQGILVNCADGGTDVKIVSSANTADFFTIEVGAEGETKFTTVDADTKKANLIFSIDGDIVQETATANGAGTNQWDQPGCLISYVATVNGIIESTFVLDLGTEAVDTTGTATHVIAQGTSAEGFFTKIQKGLNGHIYKVEMTCFEDMAGTNVTKDIDLYGNTGNINSGADVTSGTSIQLINADGNWSVGQRRETPSGFIITTALDNYKIYLSTGDSAASGGEYTAGKLMIKFYGMPDVQTTLQLTKLNHFVLFLVLTLFNTNNIISRRYVNV